MNKSKVCEQFYYKIHFAVSFHNWACVYSLVEGYINNWQNGRLLHCLNIDITVAVLSFTWIGTTELCLKCTLQCMHVLFPVVPTVTASHAISVYISWVNLEDNSAIRSIQCGQLSWAGQYKKCVQYDFQFTSEYSEFV